VLDLGRPDPERERPERPVGRGVAVAADDQLPRLREPELGSDHVDDPLVPGARRVQGDPELLAVRAQRLELGPCEVVADRPGQGRDVVIHRRHRQLRSADAPSTEAEALERLRRGDLVHEMEVDVEQGRLAGLLADDVALPERRALGWKRKGRCHQACDDQTGECEAHG